ncbi:MAG: HD domain-containing protein [bacterium]|nr:HD domain-containing protein [bacterium]
MTTSSPTRMEPERQLRFMQGAYQRLIQAVRKDHDDRGAVGGPHDFLHALMVAHYCVLIAEDELTGVLAWVAAICHNTDRLWPDFDESDIRLKVAYYLASQPDAFDITAVEDVTQAVLDHHKPNGENDGQVTVVLKDADRLANMGPNLIIRSGQHYSKLPAYDPRFVRIPDSRASYRNPMTVLHDILCALEWAEEGGRFGIRSPRAKELMKPYVRFLNYFRDLMQQQLKETYLLGYPFPEDLELAYAKK